jgi:hypothetical protein
MIRSIFTAISISFLPFVFAGEETYSQELSKHVTGLASSYEIMTKYNHPGTYLGSLKVKDTSVILEGQARYQLARNLLDVYHLCEAVSHQSYGYDAKDYPILQLAQTNFKGFEKCKREGGYWAHLWAEYFKSGAIDWGVTSTFRNQEGAKQ